MSARFTKLDTVNLADEDSEGEEGEGEREGDDYQVKLVLTDAKKHRRRTKREREKRMCVCFASWRWVLIALVAFSVSIIVSLMVAKLTSEPPQVKSDAAVSSRGTVATSSSLHSESSTDTLSRTVATPITVITISLTPSPTLLAQ